MHTVSAAAGKDTGREISCPNSACGVSVRADRARCPHCGQRLTEPFGADKLAPAVTALEQHSRRFSRLAEEAEKVLSGSREAIDQFEKRSRQQLSEHLAAATAENLRAAREEFAAAAERVESAAAEDGGVRVGTLTVRRPGNDGELAVPVSLPLLDAGHLVVRAPAERREEAIGTVATALLRTLESRPPGQIRYRVFDPVGVGSSLSAFGEFDSERVAHGLPLSDREGLRGAITELSRHATAVSSTYLRGTYGSLGEFLTAAGAGMVPYELLVLLDLPHGVDAELGESLTQLAAHAASRGISIIAHTEAGAEIDFGPTATELSCDRNGRWGCSAVATARISLDEAPSASEVHAVATRPVPPPPLLGFAALRSPERRFAASSAEGLAVVVGKAGLEPVEVRLDDDSVHGLIAGDTGSGKSNLLRNLIYGLAHDYSPAELEMYLLDFKEGVEFREFATSPGDPAFLPHARVVSVNSDRAFGVEVLEHLARVASQRYSDLPDGARKISALRAINPDTPFPRLLLVIDEFQVLFNRGDLLADRAAAALAQLASQGRAAGIHFLLSTQSISDVAAGTTAGARIEPVYKNARLRIGLRLGEGESRALLRMTNPAAAEIRERGVGIVNHDEGAEDGNVMTKFAFLSDEQATHERREAVSRATGAARPPRVFDGEHGADASRNLELRRGRGSAGTWLGSELALQDEDPRQQRGVFAGLPADPNRHLAVIGAGARSAAAVLQWAAIGFARRCSSPSPKLLLVDLLREDDDVPAGLVEATAEASTLAGAAVDVVRERDAEVLLPTAERFAFTAGETPRAVVVFGFDRVRSFGSPDILDPEPGSPRQALKRILAEGGGNHAHLLCWWSTEEAFNQHADQQESAFGLRVYLGLSDLRLQLIAPGEMDSSPRYPLAYWHDQAAGAPPRLFQLYEPFGREELPSFLGKR
jgi:DNA segregation ATPase FtsK/SpoIIIE, S-DNA-T family